MNHAVRGRPMDLASRLVQEAGLERPDGRPLHAYACSQTRRAELQRALRTRLEVAPEQERTAAQFVLWAAEHIHADFLGGQLTWAFVCEPVKLAEDLGLLHALVERGLAWWGRRVRLAEGGHRLFLYSLMVEGGMPDALLARDGGIYRSATLATLAAIEAEGAHESPDLAERLAAVQVARLPQTFRHRDTTRLLAELAASLARLRALVPEDFAAQAAERWLDRNVEGWRSDMPLRLSTETLETLIRPALAAERAERPRLGIPIATRELHRGEDGRWRSFVRVAARARIARAELDAAASGLRLRLLPAGGAAEALGGLILAAIPDEVGWDVRCLCGSGGAIHPLPLEEPLALTAFADGRTVGEILVCPPQPSPDEELGLWKADGEDADAAPAILRPVGGGEPRTRGSALWILAPSDAAPQAADGLSVTGPEEAPGGNLWRMSGSGAVRLGEATCEIVTGAEEDAPAARLVAVGPTLPGWRTRSGRGLVHLGTPTVHGETEARGLAPLPARSLRTTTGNPARLGAMTLEWREGARTRARLRIVRLPEATRLVLRETAEGVELQAEGLEASVRATLAAGDATTRETLTGGRGRLVLPLAGRPPGEVDLRLSDAETGASLELVAPWPAARGMLLDPQGRRAEATLPLAVDELRGWRAIFPPGRGGDLQFRLVGQPPFGIAAAGEVALSAHLPLVRAMLAQDTPDAEVRLRVIVDGQEGPALRIRRYRDGTLLTPEGTLHLGLPRDMPIDPERAREGGRGGRIVLHALDLGDPDNERRIEAETDGPVDVSDVAKGSAGPLLVQSRLDGVPQRAAVFASNASGPRTREERIVAYAEGWERLLEEGGRPAWAAAWKPIAAAARGGDAGILDQVQALVRVPAAAVRLALACPSEDLADVLSLDLAAPLFWPVVPLAAVRRAVETEHRQLSALYGSVIEDAREAAADADAALARRIVSVLAVRPELAGHVGRALAEAGLVHLFLEGRPAADLARHIVADPASRLVELAQAAARRFVRLPSGMTAMEPPARPGNLVFHESLQPVVDAPLMAAEIAVGARVPPDLRTILSLLKLRLVDPDYFDKAMPAAVEFAARRYLP